MSETLREAVERSGHRKVVIKPAHGWSGLNLRELLGYRDLLVILAARDVKLRYKQTLLGVIWVVLQPVVTALIFAAIFGWFAGLPSDGVPYLLFVLCGLLPWNLVTSSLQRAGTSVVSNVNLVSKVYFPRMLIPLAGNGAVLVDFLVSLIMLFIFMLLYATPLTWRVVTLPVFLLLAFVLGLGLSLLFSALNVYYRDFMYVLPFIVQAWTYASPIAYSAKIVPEKWRWLYGLNPAVGSIEGFRWALLNTSGLDAAMLLVSASAATIILLSGAYVFRRVERGFADVI